MLIFHGKYYQEHLQVKNLTVEFTNFQIYTLNFKNQIFILCFLYLPNSLLEISLQTELVVTVTMQVSRIDDDRPDGGSLAVQIT